MRGATHHQPCASSRCSPPRSCSWPPVPRRPTLLPSQGEVRVPCKRRRCHPAHEHSHACATSRTTLGEPTCMLHTRAPHAGFARTWACCFGTEGRRTTRSPHSHSVPVVRRGAAHATGPTTRPWQPLSSSCCDMSSRMRTFSSSRALTVSMRGTNPCLSRASLRRFDVAADDCTTFVGKEKCEDEAGDDHDDSMPAVAYVYRACLCVAIVMPLAPCMAAAEACAPCDAVGCTVRRCLTRSMQHVDGTTVHACQATTASGLRLNLETLTLTHGDAWRKAARPFPWCVRSRRTSVDSWPVAPV